MPNNLQCVVLLGLLILAFAALIMLPTLFIGPDTVPLAR